MSRTRLRGVALALVLGGLVGASLGACRGTLPPDARLSEPPAAASASSAKAEGAPPARASIPLAFRGEWNLRLQDCGSLANDGRLVVTGRRLEFHESSGEVVSVTGQGNGLIVKATMSGEGEAWEDTYRFHLSPDGQALDQRISPTDEGVRRLRCPGAAPD